VFPEFHGSLRALVLDRGKIAADDVDVAFDAPSRAWIGARTRPTLSFFLFEVRENTELRQSAPETFRANGRGVHRVPPRRFDLYFLVSALTTVVEDEHLLLWRTLGTLMKHPTIPAELLPEGIRALGLPVMGKVAGADDAPRPLDVWSALDGPPRPSLVYVVTLPLDLELETSAPLVLTRTGRFSRIALPEASPEIHTQIGGHVRDHTGALLADAQISVEGRAGPQATTGADGQFVLSGVAPGPLTLRVRTATGTTTLVPIEVPSDSYDIEAD